MIYLAKPALHGNEWKYVKECLDTNWISVAGDFVGKFEQAIADEVGVRYAVGVSSGTAALHMALMTSEIQPNDIVLVPNITFVASLNAIRYVGATPMLVDVDAGSWQMDVNLVQQYLYTQTYRYNGICYDLKTKQRVCAIMPVHVLGNMGEMQHLQVLARQYNLVMIEDATEALGSRYQDKKAGSLGEIACFSFNGNKLVTTGGGGMLLSNEERLVQKVRHLIHQAKVNGKEYIHDEVGYNYRLINILAAIGVAQMEQLPTFLNQKRAIAQFYQTQLQELGFKAQHTLTEVTPNHWLPTFLVPSHKQELLAFLHQHLIEARSFWLPMNQLPMYQSCAYLTHTDVSNQVYQQAISLPCSSDITASELEHIVDTIKTFYQTL